jgi:hypothetical protein
LIQDLLIASNTNSLQYDLFLHTALSFQASLVAVQSTSYHITASVTIDTLSYFSHILLLALAIISSAFHSGISANRKSAAE